MHSWVLMLKHAQYKCHIRKTTYKVHQELLSDDNISHFFSQRFLLTRHSKTLIHWYIEEVEKRGTCQITWNRENNIVLMVKLLEEVVYRINIKTTLWDYTMQKYSHKKLDSNAYTRIDQEIMQSQV